MGLRMMNVRYYVAAPGAPPPGPGLARVYARRDATVYEDPGALPRAYLAARTVPMTDGDALRTLRRGAHDPRRAAIVPPDAPALAGSGPIRPLRARRLDPTHWRIAVPGGAHGWLVLANAHRSEWRAEVDGRETRLRPTNYAATGLRVPPGARSVDVELDRTRVHAAAAVSLVAWLAILALGAGAALRARRRRAAPG
jgi:hypothetical protein